MARVPQTRVQRRQGACDRLSEELPHGFRKRKCETDRGSGSNDTGSACVNGKGVYVYVYMSSLSKEVNTLSGNGSYRCKKRT